MSFRHPVRKVRDLNRRFGELERGVAELSRLHGALQRQLEQMGDLHRDQSEALRARAEELRDSVHLVAARTALRRRTTRVLFLVHHIEAWDSLGELVSAMAATEDFEPIVASIPRHFHGMDGFGYEDEIHRQLTARGVAHIRLRDHERGEAVAMIKAIDPDLVFRQSQWDADVPDDLATERLTFSRLCLVPYETMNLSMHDRQTVDSAYHRAAWAVFCANDLALELAEQVNARGGARFRVVGHPKADRLRRAVPRWPLERGSGRVPGRVPGRVVWSAHHSVAEGWSNFGMFQRVADDMLSWAAADPDTDFVFMPHPILLPFLRSADSPWPVSRVEEWLARWRALPNTLLFTDGDYAPLLKAADVMVTDGISMLVEPQVVGLPIVWLEREDHRPLNEIGLLVRRGLHAVTSVAEARRLADTFTSGGPDPLAAVQAANVERLFGSASSVERTIRALREMIAEERPQPLASIASAPRERPGMPSRHGAEVLPPRSRRGSRDEMPVIGRGDRAAALAAPAVFDGREDSTYALER